VEPIVEWVNHALKAGHDKAEFWVGEYGFHAVVPALLVDPAGVPWAWIFLILFAGAANLNIWGMMLYGFAALSLFDHAMYWVGLKGGRPLVNKIGGRFPKWAMALEKAEDSMRGKGVWAVTFGRYLPIIGRWVGMGAGLANLPYATFALFDAIGVGLTVVGFGLPTHLVGAEIKDKPWFPQAIALAFIIGTVATTIAILWQARRASLMRRG
jgi:membrane protein DedA with SNARE-associated domain